MLMGATVAAGAAAGADAEFADTMQVWLFSHPNPSPLSSNAAELHTGKLSGLLTGAIVAAGVAAGADAVFADTTQV